MTTKLLVKFPHQFRTGQIHTKREPRVRIPVAVERERALTYNYTKSLTAQIFGDPVPSRSALAKIKAK